METPEKSAEMPQESLEELYESAPCGYLCCAADGTVVRMNRTLLGWLGHTREEVVGQRRFTSLLSLGGRVYHETHLAPLLHMQGFVDELALDLVCKDGGRLPALINCKQVSTASGESYTRFSVFNASDRRRYERELLLERRRAEQAAKAKAEFVATASHEIRNQLHSIAAATELLGLGTDAAQRERYLAELSAASSSLLNLVDDILDYSKMEAGKLVLDERPTNLATLLTEVAASVRARADLHDLELRVELDENLPTLVIADPIKLAQVLTNLCSNAFKFTERGWVKLWARVRQPGPGSVRLLLGVSDSGVGIAQNDLPALCDEFTIVSRGDSGRVRSSGLGLSICQRILGLYRSKLEVESERGSGSSFFFELSLPTVERVPSLLQRSPGAR